MNEIRKEMICASYGISDFPERETGDTFDLSIGLFKGSSFIVKEGVCRECSLNVGGLCCAPFSQTGMCDPRDREDGKSIIFKELS